MATIPTVIQNSCLVEGYKMLGDKGWSPVEGSLQMADAGFTPPSREQDSVRCEEAITSRSPVIGEFCSTKNTKKRKS